MRITDGTHSARLPVRSGNSGVGRVAVILDGIAGENLDVANGELPTLFAFESTKNHRRTAFRTPRTDLIVNERHDLLRKPDSDLRTHEQDGTKLGCTGDLYPHAELRLFVLSTPDIGSTRPHARRFPQGRQPLRFQCIAQ